MFERWEDQARGYERLPVCYPRLHPWWPWHPAVLSALAIVLTLFASVKACG